MDKEEFIQRYVIAQMATAKEWHKTTKHVNGHIREALGVYHVIEEAAKVNWQPPR